jgi:hypothetical protein
MRLCFQLALDFFDQLRTLLVDVILGIEELSTLGRPTLLQGFD